MACAVIALACVAGAEEIKNHPGQYRPYSPELGNGLLYELKGMDEAAFARMPLDDALLKRAYWHAFLSLLSAGIQPPDPEARAALADLRRRGESVTPMLLKMMADNQETDFEGAVLYTIPEVGSIPLEPYLEYARKVLRDRTQTMNGSLAGYAAKLLATHGTKEDAELLKWVMETRPYVAPPVTMHLDELNRRLGLPKTNPPRTPNRQATTGDATSGNPQGTASKPTSLTDTEQPVKTRWLVWVLLILAATGLLWVVIKKKK